MAKITCYLYIDKCQCDLVLILRIYLVLLACFDVEMAVQINTGSPELGAKRIHVDP